MWCTLASVDPALADVSWPAVVQAVASVAAVVVAVFGFIFLWSQIQGVKRTIQCEASGKVYAEDFDILVIFVDKPHLRPYFYKNVEVGIDSPDIEAVETIAELFCCHFEQVMLQLDNLPSQIRQSWIGYGRYIYRSSPAIRDTYFEFRRQDMFIADMDNLMMNDDVIASFRTRLSQSTELASEDGPTNDKHASAVIDGDAGNTPPMSSRVTPTI